MQFLKPSADNKHTEENFQGGYFLEALHRDHLLKTRQFLTEDHILPLTVASSMSRKAGMNLEGKHKEKEPPTLKVTVSE